MFNTCLSQSDAYLFVQMVDLKDIGIDPVLEQASHIKIYDHDRSALDLCHRDSTLKLAVA